MLLKCCTQYVSKFGKLSSGHRTGKDQFSFTIAHYLILSIIQNSSRIRTKFQLNQGLNRLCVLIWKYNHQK